MMKSLANYENEADSSSKLLAWCVDYKNKIKVVDLDGKQEEYAKFAGLQLRKKSTNKL